MTDTVLLEKIYRLLEFAELKFSDHDKYDKFRILVAQDLEELVERIENALIIMLRETKQ